MNIDTGIVENLSFETFEESVFGVRFMQIKSCTTDVRHQRLAGYEFIRRVS